MSIEQEVTAAQKRRVRANHYGSVTRLSGQVEHVLDSGDACQMKQLRQSLTNKPHIQLKIDNEMINFVPVQQLEEKVQLAGLIKEQISLAIIILDDGLEFLLTQKTS